MEETGILENPNLSSVCYLVLNQVLVFIIGHAVRTSTSGSDRSQFWRST